MVNVITAQGVQWTGLPHSPKTNGDHLIKDNRGHYCPKTFEMAKGKKERWSRRESNPGLWLKPPVFCHWDTTPTATADFCPLFIYAYHYISMYAVIHTLTQCTNKVVYMMYAILHIYVYLYNEQKDKGPPWALASTRVGSWVGVGGTPWEAHLWLNGM